MDRGDFSNFRSVNLDTFLKKSLSRWKKKKKKSALGSQRSKKIIADTIEKIQGDRIHKQLFVTDISMQKSLHNTNQNDNGSSNNDAMIDHIGRMWFSENFGALNWRKIDSVIDVNKSTITFHLKQELRLSQG